MTDDAPRWPLKGVKVLDLGQIYNGPYAGFLLAHAGADVVKVEPLDGEALRERGGAGSGPPLSFAMLNSNKRGIALDLKSAEGKQLLFDLVKQADILLENFAPGAMERLGIGADRLLQENPRLIYASSTGYGLSGPDRDNLAMDLTVQAIGGVMSINGPENGPPLKTGLAICDFLGATHLYAGIMTALYERSVTGKGRKVEIAMQEALYPVLASNIASLHRNGWQQPTRRGNKHPTRGSAPYNVYECADGHVAIICVRDSHWLSLVKLIGREDLGKEPRFLTQGQRAEHEDEIDGIVEAWTRARPKAEVARLLKENRVPAAPVRDLVEVTADPGMRARGMLHDVDHPVYGKVVLPTSPLRFAGSPPPEVRPEPVTIGQHSPEVMADWLGLDAADVERMRTAGYLG